MSKEHQPCVDGIWAIGSLEQDAGMTVSKLAKLRKSVLVDQNDTPIFFAGVSECPHCGGTQLLFRYLPDSFQLFSTSIMNVYGAGVAK